MNRRAWIGLLGLLVMAVLFWAVVRSRNPAPPPAATAPPAAEVDPAPPTGDLVRPRVAVRPSAGDPGPPPVVQPVTLENAGTPAESVLVNPQQVLGTVNGVALTLKDLMPLPPEKAGQAQVISVERFGFLLDRAVERELTLQTARSQGVELSAEQRQRLAELRARSNQTEEGVFDTLQHGAESTEFQQRDLGAMALQYSLAEKAGVPSPHVTTEHVVAYYQQHHAEYRALPPEPAEREAAWEVIDQDIRSKLAPEIRAQHESALKKFLDQLRASAQVAVTKP